MQTALVGRDIRSHKTDRGFTIVELLIVVVVIAILAAITIVAYNGITQRAKDSGIQSTLSQLAKRLEAAKYDSTAEAYPTTLAGLGTGDTSALTYSVSVSGKAFCLIGNGNSGTTWFVTQYQLQPSQGSCVTSDGLVGQWLMNGDGSDVSGSGATANMGAQTLTVGENGKANGAYTIATSGASASAASLPVGSSARTVLVWVYATAYPSGSWAMASTYGSQSVSGASALSISNAGRITFNAQSNDYSSTMVLPLNSWHLIGYTLSGTQVTIVYDTNTTTGTLSAMPATTNGQTHYIGSWFGTNRWNGALDDMRVYNRVLTQSEIQAIYNAGAL